MQSSRIDAPEESSATCSIRSWKVSSPHWMSSNTTTSGRSDAASSSVLRKAQAISSADVAASLSAEQRADRRRRRLVGRHEVELLQHLDDGPVGDPLAVREAAAAHDRRVDGARASATSRDLPIPASPTTVTSSQQPARSARAAMRPAEAGARARRPTNGASCRRSGASWTRTSRYAGTGSDFPLSSSGATASTSTASCTSASVGSPSNTSPGLRSLLQPGGHVDRVTGREPLVRPRHHLARHHSDPPLQPESRERFPHLDRCPHRPQCVVLVHDRHTEDGHHGVADELLDRAAVMLDDRLHPLEVACEQRAHPLGVERLSERGRPGEVAEQDGDGLALLVRSPVRRFGAALGAEPERSFRLEAATRTCGHAASLGVSEGDDDVSRSSAGTSGT